MPLGIGSNEEEQKRKAQDPFGLAPMGAVPGGVPGADPSQQAGVAWAPSVNVTPTVSAGTIKDTSGLQFDADYAQRVNNLDRGIYDAQMGRHAAITNASAQNQRQQLDAAQMQEKAREALLQRMAGSGRLRSSSTANQSSELEGNYAKYQQDLAADLAGRISGAEQQFVNAVNGVAMQKEAIFGEQQQAQQARRLAAEQAEQQRIANEQAAAAQQALLASMQNYQAPQINIGAPGIGYGGGGGGGGGYSAPEPAAPQGPNWNAQAASWNDVLNWANQQRSAYKGNFGNFSADIASLLQRDPNWAGSMMNAMGSYYGGAKDTNEVLGWLWNPIAPKLNGGIYGKTKNFFAGPSNNYGVL